VFNHKTAYFFGGASRFWWLFILVGIFSVLSPFVMELEVSKIQNLLVGIGALVIGVVLKLNYYGIQIDGKMNLTREYISVMGIKKGIWQQMPDFHRLTLTSEKVSSKNAPNGISPTLSTTRTVFTITLITSENAPVYVFQVERKKKAVSEAEKLSELLGVRLERN